MVRLHVLVNRTLDEYTTQYRRLVAKLPASDDAVILGGDINVVALGWSNSALGLPGIVFKAAWAQSGAGST